MGTLAAAGTSNSKTATEPLDASPSSRNRIANCPILISSVGLVAMRTPPVLGFTYSNAAELPVLATLGISVNVLSSDAPFLRWVASWQWIKGTFPSYSLFIHELPRREILGNSVSGQGNSRKLKGQENAMVD